MIQILIATADDIRMDLGLPIGPVWIGEAMTIEERYLESKDEREYQKGWEENEVDI